MEEYQHGLAPTLQQDFNLRRFLHGKKLLADLMLFDSRPDEVVVTIPSRIKRWYGPNGIYGYDPDRMKQYERKKTKIFEEWIWNTALVTDCDGYWVLTVTVQGYRCRKEHDDHFWNRIAPDRRGDYSWETMYGVPFFQSYILKDAAEIGFVDRIVDLVQHKGYTLARQMKRHTTKALDLPRLDWLYQKRENPQPFDFGFEQLASELTTRKIRRQIEL